MKVGDLIRLRGFDLSHRNDIPHGIIVAELGLKKYKISWLNQEIAKRWAVAVIMHEEKLELLNGAP